MGRNLIRRTGMHKRRKIVIAFCLNLVKKMWWWRETTEMWCWLLWREKENLKRSEIGS